MIFKIMKKEELKNNKVDESAKMLAQILLSEVIKKYLKVETITDKQIYEK